jgi:hypothetical protein
VQPTGFDEANVSLGPPEGVPEAAPGQEGGVGTLRAWKGKSSPPDETPLVVTCWKPDRAELDAIGRTGRVWVVVPGGFIPPMHLTGHSPFDERDGP